MKVFMPTSRKWHLGVPSACLPLLNTGPPPLSPWNQWASRTAGLKRLRRARILFTLYMTKPRFRESASGLMAESKLGPKSPPKASLSSPDISIIAQWRSVDWLIDWLSHWLSHWSKSNQRPGPLGCARSCQMHERIGASFHSPSKPLPSTSPVPGAASGADMDLETTVSILIELPIPRRKAEGSEVLESLHRGVRELVWWMEKDGGPFRILPGPFLPGQPLFQEYPNLSSPALWSGWQKVLYQLTFKCKNLTALHTSRGSWTRAFSIQMKEGSHGKRLANN